MLVAYIRTISTLSVQLIISSASPVTAKDNTPPLMEAVNLRRPGEPIVELCAIGLAYGDRLGVAVS